MIKRDSQRVFKVSFFFIILCYSIRTISQTEEAMVKAFFKSLAMTLALVAGLIAPAYAADKPAELLSVVSWHNTAVQDPVAAKGGDHGVCGEFLHRNGDMLVPFADAENRDAYTKDPKAYPIVGWVVPRLAAGGMDIVARFPNGVRDSKLGPLVMANPGRYLAAYKGANFAFSNKANMAKFEKNPEMYMLPVGGYCIGAMAADRVTRGNLEHVLYVRIPSLGVATWVTFGSENGPRVWAKLDFEELGTRWLAANANYQRRIADSHAALESSDHVPHRYGKWHEGHLGRQATNDNLQQGGRKKAR